ncbi:MAG: hypothetical protein FJ290_10105 [Planctomycetes bacterium]|nr:hypothetical protein [Planctomycetota bacterium]
MRRDERLALQSPGSVPLRTGLTEGLSATSVGRFGWSPLDNPQIECEDLLVERVVPGAIQRTVAGRKWELAFTTSPSADAVTRLSLEGSAAFRTDPADVGLREGWQKRDFDDRAWDSIPVPGEWEKAAVSTAGGGMEYPFAGYDGVAWYRFRVQVPAAWEGKGVTLQLGVVDDLDTTFFNGEQVGATGDDTPRYWTVRRQYVIPARLVRFGSENVIAVRVVDLRGGGGIMQGPVRLVSGEVAGAQAQPVQHRVLGLNWVSKEIEVRDGDSSYKLLYNCVSPGVVIESQDAVLDLRCTSPFDRIALSLEKFVVRASARSPGYGPKAALRTGSVVYDAERDGRLSENWLLLLSGTAEVDVPVLLVLQRRPQRVEMMGGRVRLVWPGAMGCVVVAQPYGAKALPGRETRAWGTLPEETLSRCRFWSQALLKFPTACKEEFWIDDAAERVGIVETFGYRHLRDEWGTQAVEIAPVPPLASLARDVGYPVEFRCSLSSLGYPTKYGSLQAVVGSNRAEYTLPFAGAENRTLLRVVGEDRFTPIVRAQMLHCLNMADRMPPKGDKFMLGDGAVANLFGVDDGGFEVMFLLPEAMRRRIRDMQAARAPFLGRTEFAWTRIEEPTTRRWYWCPGKPEDQGGRGLIRGDQDCFVGVYLECLYKYALHTGDWALVRRIWPVAQEVYSYLTLVNDWAYMASACRDWCAGGAFYDMAGLTWVGALDNAKMARVLGDEAVRRNALYVQAKAALPILIRFQARPYIARYYDLDESDVISGFGEIEPKGVLPAYCGQTALSIRGFTDNTISGEVFHPEMYDLYRQYVAEGVREHFARATRFNPDWTHTLFAYWGQHPYGRLIMGESHARMEGHLRSLYEFRPTGGITSGQAATPYDFGELAAQSCPMTLGSWAPARLLAADYFPSLRLARLRVDATEVKEFLFGAACRNIPRAVLWDGRAARFQMKNGKLSAALAGGRSGELLICFGPSRGPAPEVREEPFPPSVLLNGGFEEFPQFSSAWYSRVIPAREPKHPKERALPTSQMCQPQTEVVRSGKRAVRLRTAGEGDMASITQYVHVEAGRPYRVTYHYLVSETLSGRVGFIVQEVGIPKERYHEVTLKPGDGPTRGWLACSIEVQAPEPGNRLMIAYVPVTGGPATVYVDDVEFEYLDHQPGRQP